MKIAVVLFLAVALATAKHVKQPARQTRLDMGEIATPGQFPFAAALRNAYSPTCGATIISAKHVITEAWCYDAVSDMKVIAGCTDYYSTDCEEYNLEWVWLHPNNTGLAENDLIIISIEGEFALSDTVQVIPLTQDVVADGTSAVITGWSPELRWLDVMVQQCDSSWIDDSVICTAPSVVSSGDYGSPLIVDGALAGVPILGGGLDLHQRISPYVDWINSIIAAK